MLPINHNSGVTLLGGGSMTPQECAEALAIAPSLYCADGGIHQAPKAPLGIIGDMDSLGDKSHQFQHVKEWLISEQDSTDFDKTVRSINAKYYLCVGFLGGRLDHQLSAYNVMMKYLKKPIFLLNGCDFCFVSPRELCLKLGTNTACSVFPFTPTRVVSRGLRWPTEGITLAPGGRVATSNEMESDILHLEIEYGIAAIILPMEKLATVIEQMFGDK